MKHNDNSVQIGPFVVRSPFLTIVYKFCKTIFNICVWTELQMNIHLYLNVHHVNIRVSFGFQMNGEVFDILNYCILNGKVYIHKQKLFHENALDFYDYHWELKYKLQIERMICIGTSNDKQFSKFLFIYNVL